VDRPPSPWWIFEKSYLSTYPSPPRQPTSATVSLEDLSRKLAVPIPKCAASEIADYLDVGSRSTAIPFPPRQVQALASKFAHSSFPEGSLRVLSASHRSGTKLKVSVYERIAYHLALARAWDQIPPLVALALRQMLRVNRRLLNWRIRSLIELKQFGRLEWALEDFHKRNIRPSPDTYHLLMQGHVINNNLPKAQESIDWMIEAGFPISPETQAALISVFSKAIGPSTEVENLAIAALETASSPTHTALLNGLVRSRIAAWDPEGAYRYLLKFNLSPEELGLPLSHDSSRTLSRPSPNHETYQMLLKLFLRHRNLDGFSAAFNSFLSSGLSVDTGLAALAIRAAALRGRLDQAVGILMLLCHKDTSAMSLIAQMIAQHSRLPEQMRRRFQGLSADAQVFNTLLEVWLPRQGLKKILYLLHAMVITVGGPNQKTLGIIIRHIHCYRGVQPTHIIRFLCIAARFWPTSFDNHTYEAIVSSAIRLEAARRKGSFVEQPKRQFIEFSEILLRARQLPSLPAWELVRSLKLPPMAQQYLSLLLESLGERRVRLSSAGLALQLRHQAVIQSDIRAAENTLADMENQGMKIGFVHYAAIIEGYVVLGELEAAVAMAQRYGQQPKAVILHTIILQGHARSRQPHQAQAIFDNMLRQGISPDWAAIDALVGAWSRCGLFRTAKSTLLRFWPLLTDVKPSAGMEASLPTLLHEFRSIRRRNEPHLSRLIMMKTRFGISARRRFNSMLFRLYTLRKHKNRNVK